MSRPRILFFSEAVTLAHVARPAALASAVAGEYDTIVARAPWAGRFITDPKISQRDLVSVPSRQFLACLRAGRAVYDEPTLRAYVDDDLALIDRERPDLIVGDFRLSLSVSARLRRTPYVAITNAYWSPWYPAPPPLPVLPWTTWAPLPLARVVFAIARGPAMALQSLPLNRVRRHFGLPPLGWQLRRVYTDADWLAIADSPDIYPTPGAPPNHRYLGPIAWSPTGGALPERTQARDRQPPLAYLSLGSSGAADQTDRVIEGLLAAGLSIWHSTAGRTDEFSSPSPNIYSAPWLPGALACQHASLVVCNGGSLGVQQALAAGRPVLGLASNMDQFMNMAPIVNAGAGRLLRADRLSAVAVAHAARALLDSPQPRLAAAHLGALQARYCATDRFRELVWALTCGERRA